MFVRPPASRAPALLTLRHAAGYAFFALALRLAEQAITNTRECLTAFMQRYPGATCNMETGTHSPWVNRLLGSLTQDSWDPLAT